MSTVARELRYLREQMRVNLLANMEYRIPFLIQVTFMLLNDVFLLFFWWILFQRFDNIAGWQQSEVFLLYAFSAGAFGMAYAVFGNAGRLSNMIVEGQLDYYLALPRDTWLSVLASRSISSTIGDILFGLLVVIVIVQKPLLILAAVGLMMLAGLFFVSAVSTVHSLTFFLGNAEQLASSFSEALVSFSLYPVSIFSVGLRMVLHTILPAAFIGFVPVTLIRAFSWPLFLAMVGATVAAVALSRYVFYRGLRRYESGNLVAPRM